MTVQVRGFLWDQPDGQDRLTASDDLVINPRMFILDSGAQQWVRVGLRGPADSGVERTYRILVDQLPEAGPVAGKSRLTLRLSLPVFAQAAGATAGALSWHAASTRDGIDLTIRNAGSRHVRLERLKVTTGAQDTESEAPVYVLPNGVRTLALPLKAEAARALHVTAWTEDGAVAVDVDTLRGIADPISPGHGGG